MDAAALLFLILFLIGIGVALYYALLCFQPRPKELRQKSSRSSPDRCCLINEDSDHNGNIADSVQPLMSEEGKLSKSKDDTAVNEDSAHFETLPSNLKFTSTPECASKDVSAELLAKENDSVFLAIEDEPNDIRSNSSKPVLPLITENPLTTVVATAMVCRSLSACDHEDGLLVPRTLPHDVEPRNHALMPMTTPQHCSSPHHSAPNCHNLEDAHPVPSKHVNFPPPQFSQPIVVETLNLTSSTPNSEWHPVAPQNAEITHINEIVGTDMGCPKNISLKSCESSELRPNAYPNPVGWIVPDDADDDKLSEKQLEEEDEFNSYCDDGNFDDLNCNYVLPTGERVSNLRARCPSPKDTMIHNNTSSESKFVNELPIKNNNLDNVKGMDSMLALSEDSLLSDDSDTESESSGSDPDITEYSFESGPRVPSTKDVLANEIGHCTDPQVTRYVTISDGHLEKDSGEKICFEPPLAPNSPQASSTSISNKSSSSDTSLEAELDIPIDNQSDQCIYNPAFSVSTPPITPPGQKIDRAYTIMSIDGADVIDDDKYPIKEISNDEAKSENRLSNTEKERSAEELSEAAPTFVLLKTFQDRQRSTSDSSSSSSSNSTSNSASSSDSGEYIPSDQDKIIINSYPQKQQFGSVPK